MDVKIESSWKEILQEEFDKPYFQGIKDFLVANKEQGKEIYPPGKLIFNAFDSTPLDQVKVVILGQDPYHNPGEAMGLCFSVPQGIPVPPSLKNIFKEIHNDLGMELPNHGDLSSWAQQGVFLLNAILTVEKKKAASHRKIGWQQFTDVVIRKLSDCKTGLVFLLWGNFARSKKDLIDSSKHLILESVHPSPLAGKRFFNNQHFSKTNHYLEINGRKPIDWSIK
jgi:uracil-DNA glycosylase